MILTGKVRRLFRKEIAVFRCQTDGMLVVDSQASLSPHGGHRMKSPVYVTFIEWLFIQLGIIR